MGLWQTGRIVYNYSFATNSIIIIKQSVDYSPVNETEGGSFAVQN